MRNLKKIIKLKLPNIKKYMIIKDICGTSIGNMNPLYIPVVGSEFVYDNVKTRRSDLLPLPGMFNWYDTFQFHHLFYCILRIYNI